MNGRERIMPGFEPVTLKVGQPRRPGTAAVLLVHGIAARPLQLEHLARAVSQAGFPVAAPLLPGHGTSCADLVGIGWLDWYTRVEGEYLALKSGYSHVTVIGFSLGALLALELAANHPVDAIVLICTPLVTFFPRVPRSFSLLLLELFTRYVPTFPKKYRGPDGPVPRGVYRKIPVCSLRASWELNRRVLRRLEQVRAPALIVHATHDFTSRPEGGLILADELGSTDKKIVWIETSNHEVTRCEKRRVAIDAVIDFVRQVAPSGIPNG